MAASIQEVLRRCVVQAQFFDMDQHSLLTTAQATLLCTIGLLFSGQDTQRQQGLLVRALLTPQAKQLFSQMEDTSNKYNATLEDRWRTWALSGTLRRTAYCILQRSCGKRRPRHTGTKSIRFSSKMPSLAEANHRLHLKKRQELTLGEFTRILIIHSLYHWCWRLQNHYSNPLTHYTPVSSRMLIIDDGASGRKIWLAEVGDFSRWRDSLCDSVDTIHWQAISVTGARLGSEYPLILHCHFSRMVILAPVQEILTVAKRLKDGETLPCNASDVSTIRK